MTTPPGTRARPVRVRAARTPSPVATSASAAAAASARPGDDALRRALTVLRRADDRPRSERAYRVYLVVLALGIYAAPLLVSAARALAPDAAWSALVSPASLAGIAAAAALLLLLLLRGGATFGPVRPATGYVTFVLGGDVDRARALRPAWALTVTALAGVLGLGGLVVAASRAAAGRPDAAMLGPIITAAGAGATAAGLWLRGQTGHARRALTVVGLTAVAAALAGTLLRGAAWDAAMALAGPGGWWALSLAHAGAPLGWGASALAVVVAAASCRATGQLRGLRAHGLLAQATRVAGVSAGIARGNAAAAGGAVAGTPSRGRDLTLRAAPSPILARDLLGLRRSPETTVGAVALLVGAGALAGLTVGHRWPMLVAVVACGLGYVGVTMLAGGLRSHVVHAFRDAWLGVDYRTAAWAHTRAPLLLATTCWWVGTILAGVLAHLPAARVASALGWAPVAVLVLVAAVVTACHQGDLPPSLMSGPVTAETGESGAYLRFAWTFGMPLLGTAVGGGLLTLATSTVPAAALALAGGGLVVGLAQAAIGRAVDR